MLVPLAKVRLTRLGVEAAIAAIELHGGNGYCEDWGLTRQLRDAQCHTIWEGTENICSLDVLRAIRRDDAHRSVLDRVDAALAVAERSAPSFTTAAIDSVGAARRDLERRIDALSSLVDPDAAEALAGRLTDRLVRTVSAALLLEQAGGDARKALVAVRYARRHFADGGGWGDRIAAELGREVVAYDRIDEGRAAKAAA
jgi:hypothetical protein